MRQRKLLLTIFSMTLLFKVTAQPSLSKMKATLDLLDPAISGLKMSIINESQAGILFSSGSSLSKAQTAGWLASQLQLRQGVDLLSPDPLQINTTEVNVEKLHQYFRGIKVEHGVINATSLNGKVSMLQMEYYSIDDKFNTSPVLNEKAALQKALDFTAADRYVWTGYTGNDPSFMEPRGELVIVSTYQQTGAVCLAYKFNIYALQPVTRAYVYVNAMDGTLVLNDPIIKHAEHNKNLVQKKASTGSEMMQAPNSISVVDPVDIAQNAGQAKVQAGLSAERNTPVLNEATDNSRQNINSPSSNVTGTADTRYLGTQNIVTDNASGVAGKPFRLRQVRNGQNIITLNFQQKPYNTNINNEALAIDFLDNDNNWTAAEYDNSTFDNGAMDVQFNMAVVSDYWLNIHNRNGWDNKNGELRNYVHVNEAKWDNSGTYLGDYFFENAFWNGSNMHFGDGSGTPTVSNVRTALDVCAHESGHGITETNNSLVYQWESGGLNEGFSDIWAACIANYAKLNFSPLPGELTWRYGEKYANLDKPEKGLRDLSNPLIYNNPSTYKGTHWEAASIQTCRDFPNTDNCGVHTNSGVLSKWFYLITQGEISYNTFLTPYFIVGLGFGISQKIAYLTSLNLTPNATYATAKTVSINATATLYGIGSTEVQTVKAAWVAVAVDSNIYNMSNTPAFTTNNFTSVAVDASGDVWAGTNYNGLYRYRNDAWEKRTEVPNVRINDIKADKSGNIWIAQSGTQAGGSQALAGGVNYLRAPYGPTNNDFYTIGAQSNIPSRNVRCIYVDTNRKNDVVNPKVWMASLAYITSGNSTSGMLGQGLYNTAKFFHNVSGGLNIASNTAGVLTVGGNANEIWTFAQANNGINQLLSYNASTNNFITYYDHNTDPILPSGFVARSIYGDAKNRTWFPLANNGLIVLDENQHFHYINFANAFPPGTLASFNAICGNKYGDVYIGTNNGIVFFERGDGLIDKIDNPKNYRLFTKANGLPSNQVNALAYDTSRFKLLVATDSGVLFYEPLCLHPYCKQYVASSDPASESLGDGNWSNPANWSNNKIPDSLTVVNMKHNIIVDVNSRCKTLTILPTGSVTVKTGVNLTLYQEKQPIFFRSQKRIGGIVLKK